MLSRLLPNARNVQRTFRTSSFDHSILKDIVPGPPNQQLAALGARCVRAFTEDISFVHVVKTRLARDSARPVKRLRRRPRLIPQLEVRMERREVQGHVR